MDTNIETVPINKPALATTALNQTQTSTTSTKRARLAKTVKENLNTTKGKTQPTERVVDGHVITSDLHSHAAVAKVLMQQVGKRKVKELKTIRGTDVSVGRRQIQEMDFLEELRQKNEFDRSKELKWFSCIGDSPETDHTIKGSPANWIIV